MRSNTTIRTNDGTRIWVGTYLPPQVSHSIMVIAPSVGTTSEYYDDFANYLCERGFTVITFDYRGVGNSAPESLLGYKANMHQWAVQDINAVLIYTKQQYPNQEIIYLGHSIGGEIIGLAPASQYISKMIFVCSALSCAKLFPLSNRIKIAGLKMLARTTSRLYGYFPGKKLYIFDDLPNGVVHEWANWCDRSNGLFDIFPDNNYRKLTIPVLAFTFEDDWHCPPRAVKELLIRFENAMITWYHLKPKDIGIKKIGQKDFFKTSMQQSLWEMLLKWIDKEYKKPEQKDIVIKRHLSE